MDERPPISAESAARMTPSRLPAPGTGSKDYAVAAETFRRPARCTECDGPIYEGDYIVRDGKGEPWRHVDCDEAKFVRADA